MINKSLSTENLFRLYDESTDKTFFGCTQEWYNTEWQRKAGCGPTTASNIILYMSQQKPSFGENGKRYGKKEESLALMEEVWQYVTPTNRGVNTTKLFYESLMGYMKSKGLNAAYRCIDVPEETNKRPGFGKLLEFIGQALEKDAPVAFLNLCNGEEKNLDRWHWVTIISLDYTEDGESAFVNILDEGMIKRIDIALWYKTTVLGGGFIHLEA